jgi:ribonuclease R
LLGRQSRRRFAVGDQLKVFVARVDVFKRQVDFAIADEQPAKPRQNGRQERSRGGKRRS